MLKRLQVKGITILVSTPYMDEASMCDRIALIKKGKILKIDSPTAIISKFDKSIYAVSTTNKYQLILDLKEYESMHSVYAFGEFLHYIDQKDDFQLQDLKKYLGSKNHTSIEIHLTEPTIEDVFMDL
jgi:ABC-type multidrug transport system ATPase subunit